MGGAEWMGGGDLSGRLPRWEGLDGVLRMHAAALAVIMLVFGIGAACAEPPFFARKTITITVGYSAGRSYDLYRRVVARPPGKQLPAQPAGIAQKMPGAGRLKAPNYHYA